MAKFADALEDLVTNHGLTNVRWAEVGNEPNTAGAVTLDAVQRARTGRFTRSSSRGASATRSSLMGGGLVESAGTRRNHYAWMQWIAANMGDVVDAYAEHVYWYYDDPGRLEYRLRDTCAPR